MSPGKPRSDRRCGKGNTKTPRSVDHILQLPLWCLLLLRHNNNASTHAREQNPTPQQTHLSRSRRAPTHGKPIVFLLALSRPLQLPQACLLRPHCSSRLLRDIAAFFRRSSVRPSFRGKLSSERRIRKARTMAPKDVDTASFVFCSHWYVPPPCASQTKPWHSRLKLLLYSIVFLCLSGFLGVFAGFLGSLILHPVSYSWCSLFFLFCLRAWNISRIGGLCFLTFCIRRGIENFLNFQVVFDLIIQKKIWPVHQRLFAILMCKKKNWDGCTSAPQQFSASLCGGACGFSDWNCKLMGARD